MPSMFPTWMSGRSSSLVKLPSLSLHWLIAQHNEHRLATTNLLIWLLWHLDGWNLVTHQLLNYALYALLLAWVVRMSDELAPDLPRWLMLSFLIFLLSPVNWENHLMGYQSQVHLWLLLFLVACYLLFRRDRSWPALVAACAAMTLSIYSSASGFVACLVLICVFAVLKLLRARTANPVARRSDWLQLLFVTTMTGAVLGSWLVGYRKPAWHPAISLPDTWAFWDYFLNIVSFAFGIDGLSVAMGVLCLLLVITPIGGYLLRERGRLGSAQWTSFVAVAVVLAVLASISIGRAGFGAAQAKTSRYAEFGMMLIPLTVLNWHFFLSGRERYRSLVIAALWMFCFLTFWSNWKEFEIYQSQAKQRIAGAQCIQQYCLHGGEALCPTLIPIPIAARIEQAKRLQASFYRSLCPQADVAHATP